MNVSKRWAVAAVLLAASSPALADKYFAVTPSGATEVVFAEKPTETIGKLSSKCIDVKWTVTSSSTTELVCEAPMNFGQSLVGQLLMGNSYSTSPRRFFRFNVAEINGLSRVQASGWMELQMAFGQMRRTDFTGPEFHNGAMNFMTSAGGKLPVGTTFPNHVMVGFENDWDTVGKTQSARVTKIQPGSAAEKAGLQTGDVISKVAGERIKGPNNVLDATARAAQKPTYEVEVIRAGKPITLTVERAFRPSWSEAVTPVIAAASQPTPPPASVADELGKLAKLKADGVLSETEFDAQKRKLLGQ